MALTTKRKLKHRLGDNHSIDIDDAYAMDFWAKEINVPKAKLTAAVLAVGPSVLDVKRELKNKQDGFKGIRQKEGF